jgi:hypothetical protein
MHFRLSMVPELAHQPGQASLRRKVLVTGAVRHTRRAEGLCSVVRGYLNFRASIPPRWIKNARGSRKRIEPEIAAGFRSVKRLRIRRPRARVAIMDAQRELRSALDRWETAYRKENFYRGIRILFLQFLSLKLSNASTQTVLSLLRQP